MFTIENNVTNEYIINKSRFITKIYKVNDINEVNNYLNIAKNEYKDATHICYAYVINDNFKCFDDGEPSKTAGIPILNVLVKNNLNYILCIVIRYFGGIKLGSGGLIRAYKNSCSSALEKCLIKEIKYGKLVKIVFNYDNLKNVDYLLKDVKIIDKYYNNDITYIFEIDDDLLNVLYDKLSNYNIDIIKKIIV